MRMKKTSASHFKGLPINASAKPGNECYVQILSRIHDQLMSLLSYHSRVKVVRIDLRFPNNHEPCHRREGQLLSAYIKKVKQVLGSSAWGQVENVVHGAVKEIGNTGKTHFHLFFGFQAKHKVLGLINGNGHSGLWRVLDQAWKELSAGTTHIIPRVHTLQRGDFVKLGCCFYHLSYMAKARTKHFNTGENYKRYVSSRVKRKNNLTASDDPIILPGTADCKCEWCRSSSYLTPPPATVTFQPLGNLQQQAYLQSGLQSSVAC